MAELINEIKVPKDLIESKPVHLCPFINKSFVRALVVGSSETGKTFWTLNKFIPNMAPISNLYLISGSGFNDGVYQNAIKYFRERGTKVFTYEKIDDIQHILKNKELEKCNPNCVVLDDWTKDDLKNKLLVQLYSHGRSIVTISFRYYDFSQQIRSVINYLIIFRTNQPNYIYQNSLKGIFPNLKAFLEMYEEATKQEGDERGCLMIALDPYLDHEALRVKRGIDGFLASYFQNLF